MLSEIAALLERLRSEITGASSVGFTSDGVIFFITVDWYLEGKVRRIVKTFDPDRLSERSFEDEKVLILFIGYCVEKIANTTTVDEDCYTLV